MNIKVMYHSKTGNTKRIAEAIAEELCISAEMITENSTFSEPIDFLFIGDGVYFAKMNKKTKAFIDTLNGKIIKNAAVFGTFGGQKKAIIAMKVLLSERGIQTSDQSFSCKGRAWFLANRNHPDKNDLDNAKEFARHTINSILKKN